GLCDPGGEDHPPGDYPHALSPGALSRTAAAAGPRVPGRYGRGAGLCPHLRVIGLCPGGGGRRSPCTPGHAGGPPLLDLGPGGDGCLVPAPDIWPPDRRRCHAATRLTRGAAAAAPSRRRRATVDRPGGVGSAPGPRLLALSPAQR